MDQKYDLRGRVVDLRSVRPFLSSSPDDMVRAQQTNVDPHNYGYVAASCHSTSAVNSAFGGGPTL